MKRLLSVLGILVLALVPTLMQSLTAETNGAVIPVTAANPDSHVRYANNPGQTKAI
jgi:hypothetical protein